LVIGVFLFNTPGKTDEFRRFLCDPRKKGEFRLFLCGPRKKGEFRLFLCSLRKRSESLRYAGTRVGDVTVVHG